MDTPEITNIEYIKKAEDPEGMKLRVKDCSGRIIAWHRYVCRAYTHWMFENYKGHIVEIKEGDDWVVYNPGCKCKEE